jgi:hypothetical protein
MEALQLNMATLRLTHDQREQEVLSDLERHFPDFTGHSSSWVKVPDGQDPPDFLSRGPKGPVGLELIEWLDGKQMGPAKGREAQRKNIRRVVRENWQTQYKPQYFNLAIIFPKWNVKIDSSEEARLRQEFFDSTEIADREWLSNSERNGRSHYHVNFSNYALMGKYFRAIRYNVGKPHGMRWIDIEGDGGAYNPAVSVLTLEEVLGKKLNLYSTSEKQAQLEAHGLAELYLLVHGGFNTHLYNTPSAPLTLEQIAQRGAAFCAAHSHRNILSRDGFSIH